MHWDRTCATCNRPFVADHACRKFCSTLCRFPPKDCEVCGKSFSTRNIRTQRYCSKQCAVSVRDMAAVRALVRTPRNGFPTKATCEACGRAYAPTSSRQKNCRACSPTKGARMRLNRYGVSHTQWLEMVARHDGKCWICKRRDAYCQDHDHDTDEPRGALCRACNMALGFLEDEEWLRSAWAYLADKPWLPQKPVQPE